MNPADEILEYCRLVGDFSYEHMKQYAAEHRPDWIAYLKTRNKGCKSNGYLVSGLLKAEAEKAKHQNKYQDFLKFDFKK